MARARPGEREATMQRLKAKVAAMRAAANGGAPAAPSDAPPPPEPRDAPWFVEGRPNSLVGYDDVVVLNVLYNADGTVALVETPPPARRH